MTFSSISVLLAWATLLGTACVARFERGATRGVSILAVCICYLAMAAVTLATLGLDQRGVIAAAGVLLPTIVAIAMVCSCLSSGRRRRRPR